MDGFNPFGIAEPKTGLEVGLERVENFVRPVTRALEPLQGLQDFAFGVTAGILDPNTTIAERLGRNGNFLQSVSAYLPMGRAPNRPATGREIATLLGVPDGREADIAGFALDVFADPLAAGAWVRGIGKITKLKQLIKVGDNIDKVLSPAFYLKGVSAPIANYASRRMDTVLDTVRSARGTVAGIPSSTVADLIRGLSGKERGLQTLFGEEVGGQLRRIRQGNEQLAPTIFDEVAVEAGNIERLTFGLRETGMMRRIGRILSGDIRNMNEMVSDMPEALRLTVEKELTSLVDSRGILFLDPANASSVTSRIKDPLTPIVGDIKLGGAAATPRSMTLGFETRTVQPIDGVELNIPTAAERGAADTMFNDAVARITQAATADGLSNTTKLTVDEVVRRFTEGYQRSVVATTRLGLELSGYPMVKEALYDSITSVGGSLGDAQHIFTETLRRVMAGESVDDITEIGGIPLSQMFNNQLINARTGPRRMSERTRAPAMELQGVQNYLGGQTPSPLFPTLPVTTASPGDVAVFNEAISVGDLLGTTRLNTSLDIDTFIRSLSTGHLRQSLAMFADKGTYDSYIRSLESGRFMLSNVVDSLNVRSIAGIDPDAATEVENFLQQIEGAGNIRASNFSRDQLVAVVTERLTRKGRGGREAFRTANDAVALIAREANGSPALRSMIDQVRDFQTTYNGGIQTSGDFGNAIDLSGGAFLDPRSNISQNIVNAIGRQTSLAYPLIETGEFASKIVPKAKYLQEISAIGQRYGYVMDPGVRTGRHTARYVDLPNEPEIYGELAGRAVHPYLAKEINSFLQVDSRKMPQWWNNFKATITGGYLARPSVGFANLIGGIYTTTMMGVNPLSLVKSLARTYRPLNDFFEGKAEPDIIRALAARVDLVGSSMIGDELQTWSKNAMKAKYGLSGEGVTEAVGQLNQTIMSMLKNPLRQTGAPESVTRWFGLDGFQFIENWIKVATFDAMREGNRLNPQMVARGAEYIDDVAAQYARFSAFDYSELPYALESLKKFGIPFLGFPYFVSGRNIGAVLNNPAAIAMADRLPDAMATLSGMDEDEKRRFYASMPEWLRNSGGSVNFISAPLGKFRENGAGDQIIGAIPYRQLLPTSSGGNGIFSLLPFGALSENIGTLGVIQPFIEIMNAMSSGTGEAIFSKQYGKRVFEEGSEGWNKAAQIFQFAFESLAPGSARGAVDMAKVIANNTIPMPEGMARGLYSATEMVSGKPDKEIGEQLFSMFFRSTTPIATEGRTAGWKKEIKRLEFEMERELTPLRRKRKEAMFSGDQAGAQLISQEIARKKQELAEQKQLIRKAVQ